MPGDEKQKSWPTTTLTSSVLSWWILTQIAAHFTFFQLHCRGGQRLRDCVSHSDSPLLNGLFSLVCFLPSLATITLTYGNTIHLWSFLTPYYKPALTPPIKKKTNPEEVTDVIVFILFIFLKTSFSPEDLSQAFTADGNDDFYVSKWKTPMQWVLPATRTQGLLLGHQR